MEVDQWNIVKEGTFDVIDGSPFYGAVVASEYGCLIDESGCISRSVSGVNPSYVLTHACSVKYALEFGCVLIILEWYRLLVVVYDWKQTNTSALESIV